MGGLVIGQEIARQMGLRFLFLEKVDDQLELRRNFKFSPGEKVLIIEDVITRGGRVLEAIKKCREHGAEPVGIGVIVDRSQGKTTFEIPHHSLAELSFPTYPSDQLPHNLALTKLLNRSWYESIFRVQRMIGTYEAISYLFCSGRDAIKIFPWPTHRSPSCGDGAWPFVDPVCFFSDCWSCTKTMVDADGLYFNHC